MSITDNGKISKREFGDKTNQKISTIAAWLSVVIVLVGIQWVCNWLCSMPIYVPENLNNPTMWESSKFMYQPMMVGRVWLPLVTLIGIISFLVKVYDTKIESAITSWLEK